MENQNLSEDIAENNLGRSGRVLRWEKSLYVTNGPRNVVFFNANVFDQDGNKIWFGDIDLTVDGHKLNQLATELGKSVYLTVELPWRYKAVVTNNELSKAALTTPRDVVRYSPQQTEK